MAADFYVYAITDGPTCLYVGKGKGNRGKVSARKHGGELKILKECATDAEAFEEERRFIAELLPLNNQNAGGWGGWSRPKPLTAAEKKIKREYEAFVREMQEVGPRRYVARFLLTKMDERNCEALGSSKVDVSRLREVANGGWA